jgi:hypothetical protein
MGVNAPPGMWVRWLVLQLLWARMRGGQRGGAKSTLGAAEVSVHIGCWTGNAQGQSHALGEHRYWQWR